MPSDSETRSVAVESPGNPTGSFRKLGVPYFGVLIIRILLLENYIRVPYFRKLPTSTAHREHDTTVISSFLDCISRTLFDVSTFLRKSRKLQRLKPEVTYTPARPKDPTPPGKQEVQRLKHLPKSKHPITPANLQLYQRLLRPNVLPTSRLTSR